MRSCVLAVVATCCAVLAAPVLAGDPVTNVGMPRPRAVPRTAARVEASFTSYTSATTFTTAAGTTDKIGFAELSSGATLTTQYTPARASPSTMETTPSSATRASVTASG